MRVLEKKMRKKYWLCTMTLLIMIVFGGCKYRKNIIEFSKDLYKREYSYSGVFDIITAEYNGSTYSFEQAIIDEPEASKLVKEFDDAKKQIIDFYNADVAEEKIKVYVVDDNRLVGPVIDGDALFLPKEIIENSAFRYHLVQLISGRGQCARTFNDYKSIFNVENAEQPTLFPIEDFNTEERDIIEKTELYIDGDNNYIFKTNTSKFIISNKLLDEDAYRKVIELIRIEAEIKDKLKEYLAEAGINKSVYGSDVDNITYHIENKGGRSYAHIENGQIDITLNDYGVRTLEHELMHGFFQDYEDMNKYWLEEGFCDYVAYVLYPEEYMVEYIRGFVNDEDYDNGDFKEYYSKKNGNDSNVVRLYYDYVVDRLYQGKDVSDYPKLKDKVGVNLGPNTTYTGVDLSYTEAMSFVEYLIDKKSKKELFTFITSDASYEEWWGKSYEELKTEWINSISE